jgi:AcrR family transcriptional regulator
VRSAIRIARDQGVNRLTISSVAAAAKVSKGGLLYHFPTKDDLVVGVLSDTLKDFTNRMEQFCAEDSQPGGRLRAFVECSFSSAGVATDIGAALLSGILATDQPVGKTILSIYQDSMSAWTEKMLDDGVEEDTAILIVLAADGLFLNEALGLRPLSPTSRKQFLLNLRSMTTRTGPLGTRRSKPR